jgi:hypothetical protein
VTEPRPPGGDLESALSGAAAPPAGEPLVESWSQRLLRLTGFDALSYPSCKAGRLHPLSERGRLPSSASRGPP